MKPWTRQHKLSRQSGNIERNREKRNKIKKRNRKLKVMIEIKSKTKKLEKNS